MNAEHARQYIRHLAEVPLEVSPHGIPEQLSLQLNNVSVGGLSFDSPSEFSEGSLVKIKINYIKPIFRVNGIVQWCEALSDHFEVGVRFLDEDDAFRVRMVEQVCHIEQYRHQALLKEGRRISKNKASSEWIEKHGAEFPHSH